MNTRDVYGRELVPVVTSAEAAAHDQAAREVRQIPERLLMENAGRALALITHTLFPSGRIVGVAGSGHNGGDTIVALRALRTWGRDVTLVRASDRPIDEVLLHGVELEQADGDAVPFVLGTAAVILDGILGTGGSGEPRGRAAEMIVAINESGRPVIAVDLPSANAVQAVATVAFGFPKIECCFQPARSNAGRLIVVDIAFPPMTDFTAQYITPQWCAPRFPKRPANANKGISGRLLLVAGSHGMAGAAVIAGSAAVRSGTGLVRIASASVNREIIQKSVPEATFFEPNDIDFSGLTALIAGPGLGATGSTRELLQNVFGQTAEVPTLLDADALNVYAGDLAGLKALAAERPLLLTPHPRELSRLTERSVEDIVAAPLPSAQQVAAETGATVLLKGQPSVVAHAGEPVLISCVGSSDFAVAGMGDQLAGVTGAMLAAGLDPRSAAALGLFYSGRAGDIANLGRSLTPTDVNDYLARAFAQPGPAASPLGFPFITFDQPARW